MSLTALRLRGLRLGDILLPMFGCDLVRSDVRGEAGITRLSVPVAVAATAAVMSKRCRF